MVSLTQRAYLLQAAADEMNHALRNFEPSGRRKSSSANSMASTQKPPNACLALLGLGFRSKL
jgi:hypothetical protein